MEHQFDDLAKALDEGMSRREALHRVGGSLAAALLVSLGWSREAWGDTRAACEAGPCAGLKGREKSQCMGVCRLCASASSVCGSPSSKTCCSTGLTCCNGTCTDTATDVNNCSACSNPCGKTLCWDNNFYSQPTCVDSACGFLAIQPCTNGCDNTGCLSN
jgi:hypothetical protein